MGCVVFPPTAAAFSIKGTPLCSLLLCRNMFNLHVTRSGASECRPQKVMDAFLPLLCCFCTVFIVIRVRYERGQIRRLERGLFLTPLKFRITSGCQRVTLSKSFTT